MGWRRTFKALEHGIDISIQAGTKYLVGHSDIMIGTAVANARTWDKLREHSYLMGQWLMQILLIRRLVVFGP